MKIKEMLKNFGMKNAEAQIDPRTSARFFFEPKPPAKLLKKMEKANNTK